MKKNHKPYKIVRLDQKKKSGQEGERMISCVSTEHTVSKEELPYLVRKRLFLIRPEIVSARFCYVPCWKVKMNFSISYFRKGRSEDGAIEFIVDGVKGCGVIEENLKVPLVRRQLSESRLIQDPFTQEQAEKKAIVDARWKVLMARYKKPPELETKQIKKFYRPYYDVEYTYGKGIKKQWIAADAFGNYFVYN